MAQKQIEIEVLSVSAPTFVKTARGGYNTLEIAYKNLSFTGKVEGKKLVDFNNQGVFTAAKALQQGQKVVVTQSKGDEDKFWNWTNIGEGVVGEQQSEGSASQSLPSSPEVSTSERSVKRVTGSNYETPEERARRQVYIVRQSSISAALSFHDKVGGGDTVEKIIETAKEFANYVLNVEKSEIPF